MTQSAIAFAALLALAGDISAAEPAHRISLEATALTAFAREPVSATVHGQALHCTGTPLAALLQASGALPEGKSVHGAGLAQVVRVTARDGYRVAFSLVELDPDTGNTAAFVVDTCDGKPLDAHDGPLRLLVPGDKRAARSVRQLQSIDIFDTP